MCLLDEGSLLAQTASDKSVDRDNGGATWREAHFTRFDDGWVSLDLGGGEEMTYNASRSHL